MSFIFRSLLATLVTVLVFGLGNPAAHAAEEVGVLVYARALAAIFVIGTFIRILKATPATNVVDQNRFKILCAAFHICEELFKCISPVQT